MRLSVLRAWRRDFWAASPRVWRRLRFGARIDSELERFRSPHVSKGWQRNLPSLTVGLLTQYDDFQTYRQSRARSIAPGQDHAWLSGERGRLGADRNGRDARHLCGVRGRQVAATSAQSK